MPPKRKIPSRKLQSRPKPAKRVGPDSKPQSSFKRSFKSNSKSKTSSSFKPNSSSEPVEPKIAACFWDMGFEEIPTMEELRQRYKELSLVLHPDAGGSKQAFLALRTNYETAQSLLTPDSSSK